MNNPHKNARMTPLGRAEMVRRIVEEGRPVPEVAAGFGISERTARKWLGRWRREGAAGLENRSSRPRSADDGASVFWKDTAARLRREYRLTGEEIDWLHELLGYGVLALVGMRVVWGFIGSPHARFRDFAFGRATTLAYARAALALSRPPRRALVAGARRRVPPSRDQARAGHAPDRARLA